MHILVIVLLWKFKHKYFDSSYASKSKFQICVPPLFLIHLELIYLSFMGLL